MKNSVWYSKLWQKKMEELSLPEDPNTAWSEMQSILDNDPLLNNAVEGKIAAKTIGSKLVAVFGYVLPVAAMISVITYLAVKEPKHIRPLTKSPLKRSHSEKKGVLVPLDSNQLESPDTTARVMLTTTTQGSKSILTVKSFIADTLLTRNNVSVIGEEINQLTEFIPNVGILTTVEMNSLTQPSPLFRVNIPGKNNYPRLVFSSKAGRKIKKQKRRQQTTSPAFNFGINSGLSMYSTGKNAFLGVSVTYALSNKLLLNSGITLNINRQIKGQYEHPNYRLDSGGHPIRILDSRKFNTIDIPITLEYRISNLISIKAGPVFSFASKQKGTGSQLDKISNPTDTVYHSKQIKESLSNTAINKVGLGFTGGITIRIKQFSIEANYQQNSKPYKISSDLGAYEYQFKSFQIGLGYRFK